MKNSIKLTALALLFTTGVFAATAPIVKNESVKPAAQVSFTGAANALALNVDIFTALPDKAVVTFYDADNHMLIKDRIKAGGKRYDLSNLEIGNYVVKVSSNKNVITKTIHIYESDRERTFFIMD